jgi:hypothetical protein
LRERSWGEGRILGESLLLTPALSPADGGKGGFPAVASSNGI